MSSDAAIRSLQAGETLRLSAMRADRYNASGRPMAAGDGEAMKELSSLGARRFRDALAERGFEVEIRELDDSTRTAAEAASAVGCEIAQIAKSLVFRTVDTGLPVLVVASGPNRVDEATVAASVGAPVEKADAEFVRKTTGFAIGGVPPAGHAMPMLTIIDADLARQPVVWAAAGTPNAVFRLSGEELVAMTGGQVLAVA